MLSTEPTPSGESALDPFHALGVVKRLRGVPLESFQGSDTFLRLLQARPGGAWAGLGQVQGTGTGRRVQGCMVQPGLAPRAALGP